MLSKPGTYALIFSSTVKKMLAIGKLGSMDVTPGWYVYVGSGRGPGGVKARVSHHYSISSCPRWHMDYLRPYLSLDHIWYTFDKVSWECNWAGCISQMRGANGPLMKFGASDCRCPSHLFFFETAPLFKSFKQRIRSRYSAHPKIYLDHIAP